MSMIVADAMTRQVLAIDPDAPLVQAVRLMTEHKVSGLPVVDRDGRVAGMLTEGDLIRRAETGTDGQKAGWFTNFFLSGWVAENYVLTHGRRVGEVMSNGAFTVTENMDLAEAVELMRHHRVKRLPVLRDGRLCGIVSRADLVRELGKALSVAPVNADDAAIATALRAAIDREGWADDKMVTIAVNGGVIDLDGCLFDTRKREALGVLAENIPGVTKVANRIICIEQNSGMVTYDPSDL
jgi:CBS domain-containing protein